MAQVSNFVTGKGGNVFNKTLLIVTASILSTTAPIRSQDIKNLYIFFFQTKIYSQSEMHKG